jgi:hypothetical protein
MSDASRLTRLQQVHPSWRVEARQTWLIHAGEVAHWTAQLLAWLWLGQQGQRLGWPLASGVLAVAVWWAMRLVCRGAGWAFRCPSAVVGLLGLGSSLGVLGLGWAVSFAWPHGSMLALALVALVWGVWSALIETRSQVSTFQPGLLPWPPIFALCLLGLSGLGGQFFNSAAGGGSLSVSGVGLLLALCAAVLYARDRLPAGRARACTGTGAAQHNLLAPSAMGLMMGTLWLGHDWCMGTGWTTSQVVATHVALMTVLPTLVAVVLNGVLLARSKFRFTQDAQECSGLALISLGAMMWLGNSPAHGLLAMLLPSVAWALHCNRSRAVSKPWAKTSLHVQRGLALCLGPVLLVLVGVASAEQGPQAMQWALVVLGVLATLCLLNKLWELWGVRTRLAAFGWGP